MVKRCAAPLRLRLLGVLLLDSELGPLVTMVVQMQQDMLTFAGLCLVFIFAFGIGIVPLGFGIGHVSCRTKEMMQPCPICTHVISLLRHRTSDSPSLHPRH